MIISDKTLSWASSPTRKSFEPKLLSKSIKSIVLASGISASLLAGPAVFAAETGEEGLEDQKLQVEEVLVYGIRASLRNAIDRKKMAGTATDSIVAEDIGEFPDKNVGEALQRVTGVQLGREFGEGTSVSIRGVEPQLVNVEVNGVSAIGASDPEARSGRSVDFASMASELVKALDVIKGSEARLTEGGIGGTVQVITRKPNDFDDHYLQVSAENQYNDLVEENNQKYNLTGVYKFTEDFGALLNLTFGDKDTTYHALRNTEWVRQGDYDNSPEKTYVDQDYASVTNQADCLGDSNCLAQWYDLRARIPRTSIWARDEDRISANGMVQWNITDKLSAHVGYTYNNRDFTQSDNNLQLEVPSDASITDITVRPNHNVSSFVTTPSSNTLIVNRAVHNGWELETTILDAGFEYEDGNLKVEGTFGHSEQTQDIDQIETRVTARRVGNILVEFDSSGAPIYDLSTGINGDASDPVQNFDPNAAESYWYYARVQNKPIVQENDETIGKLDVTYTFDEGFFTKARAGIRVSSEYQDHSQGDRRITRIIGNNYGDDTWTAADQLELINNNANRLSGFFGDFGDLGVPVPDGWLGLNPLGFYQDFLSMNAGNITDSENTFTYPGFFEVERDTQAIYLQADFATEVAGFPLWGNIGGRYVRTESDTTGDATIRVQVDSDPDNPDAGNMIDPDHPLASQDRKTLSNDYDEFLPSINLNLGLIPEELILYAGAAKVMAHPKAKDLNVAATCTIYLDSLSVGQERANECSAGNPRLQPYVANQWDVALNWYPNNDTLISAAYFVKKLDSWVLDDGTRFDQDFFGDGILYEVDQPLNGSGATTKGYELTASTFFSMLPAPLSNMGASANYTHMEAEDVGLFNQLTGEELPFPSQSEDSYNLTWFYETDLLSLKLAYNYRDGYLLAPADRGGNPISVDDAGFLDAKIVFRPQEGALSNFKFYVDARNLLEEGNIYLNGPGRISEIRYSGREFAVGFTYTM